MGQRSLRGEEDEAARVSVQRQRRGGGPGRVMVVMTDGDEVFVIAGHTHMWDGSPANHKNRHGREFIDCFYDYHRNLSPADYVWPKEKFERYTLETLVQDLF